MMLESAPGVTEERATAVHEAGHAVAAVYLRRGFKAVSIVADDHTLGRLTALPVGEWFRPDIVADARTRNLVEHHTMIALAGPEAESRYRGWVDTDGLAGAEHDHECALDLVTHASGSAAEAETYLEWLRFRVLGMIRNPSWWSCIEHLADELTLHGTIPGRRAAGMVRAHYRDHLLARGRNTGIIR